MGRDGYIKSYRKMLENPVVTKDADHFAIWNYLLLEAQAFEKEAYLGGKKITLKPGQLTVGRRQIAQKFRVEESKVQRVLKLFETEQLIEQQTTNRNRLISIVEWSKYQSIEQQSEQQMNNKCTTSEQQMHTPKEREKERKKEINKNDLVISFGSDVLQDKIREWLMYKSEKRQAYKPTGLRALLTRIQKQVSEYGEQAVIELIDECMSNQWNGIIWDKLSKPRKDGYVPEPNIPKRWKPPDENQGGEKMPDELRKKLSEIF